MKIKNQTAYNEWHNTSLLEYESVIIKYADELANMLEEKFNEHPATMPKSILPKHIEKIFELLDKKYPITGYQHNCVIEYLSKIWDYGDILQKWYDKTYG